MKNIANLNENASASRNKKSCRTFKNYNFTVFWESAPKSIRYTPYFLARQHE